MFVKTVKVLLWKKRYRRPWGHNLLAISFADSLSDVERELMNQMDKGSRGHSKLM